MHRLFVAIRPPEAIRDRLIDAMDDAPNCAGSATTSCI